MQQVDYPALSFLFVLINHRNTNKLSWVIHYDAICFDLQYVHLLDCSGLSYHANNCELISHHTHILMKCPSMLSDSSQRSVNDFWGLYNFAPIKHL